MGVSYALSNPGFFQEIEDEIRLKHPGWNDEKVTKERNKILAKATLYNKYNKKAKKPKKEKKPKGFK